MSIPTNPNAQDPANPYRGREGLVYVRVSSKRQELDGTGLESQEGRCARELELLNVPHVQTFPDTFTGGGDFMKRPAMREALAYIDTHPSKKFVLVFDDLKRFARDAKFHFNLREAFKTRDVMLRCLNYVFDESPEGRFTELIMAGQAQLEREQNRRQVVQKQTARLELGYWAFVAKRGYRMERNPAHGKISVPDPKDKDILIYALEGFANGTFVRKIDACRYLVEKGFWKTDPKKRIVEFDKMLRSSFYAGFVEYAPWGVSRRTGHHEPLISEETFQRIQKRLKNEGKGKRVRVDISEDFPLRGLVLCAACEGTMTAAWSKGRKERYPYYFCKNPACAKRGLSIKKSEIENAFDELLKRSALKSEVNQLLRVVFDRVWQEEAKEFRKDEARRASAEKERKLMIQQLTDLAVHARSQKVRETYEAQIEKLALNGEAAPQTTDLTVPYRTAFEKATAMLENPVDVWKKTSAVEKQRLFFFVFDKRIAYNRENGYRTDETSLFSSLFQDFLQQNTSPID
ncbi:recombinase family protein [Candidatus Uhrbacteria bacterium]|nr:recombinase family protein [Candidatus Uhrbacteria bacterium]